MAQCKLTPHEFIQHAFSPMVAVMCTPMVEQACQKNNLSFTEMIQPFCKLGSEAYIREPSGTSMPVRNVRICMVDVNSRPPQPTLARKFLNESVSLSTCEKNSSLAFGNQTIDIPADVPWFEAWRDTFLQVQFPSDHEFTKHYVACIFVAMTTESNIGDTLHQMNQQLHQMQNMSPAKLPKWFCPNVLRYYVIINDALDADQETAEAVFNTVKTGHGAANSYLLQINSRKPGQNDEQCHLPDPWSQFLIRQLENQEISHDSSPRTPADVGGVTGMPSRLTTDVSCDGENSDAPRPTALEMAQEAGEQSSVSVTLHPLSPDADAHISFNSRSSEPAANHINTNVWAGQPAPTSQGVEHGACLSSSDRDGLHNLVQDFIVKALLPYIEKQIQQLSDIISNKKGVSRSLFSATKRWFGSNKPGLPGNMPVNAVIYSSDAPELQLRRLGDLCFMFGQYTLAFQAYHSAKRDFSADQAWLYYAGALEMAALAAFMQGEPTRKAQEYMDESIVTYLNSCKMPQFATRATLLSTECLKGRNLYSEAAKQLIRMTSEDSDLRSALLLEQASYCYLKATRPRMARKYAFHIVLAGHRYSKAGQRRHSLRCYRQAFQVYENKSWSLAEDHIHFTIGRQAANLNQVEEAATAFSHLLSLSSRQSTVQQAAFLKEFLATQKQLLDEASSSFSSGLPILPLPLVNSDRLRVLLGPMSAPPTAQVVPASNVSFVDEPVDSGTTWFKLEELLVAEALGAPPMIFKPTVQLFTSQTNNVVRPTAVVGEPVNVSIHLENPLHISLPLLQVHLLWSFVAESAPDMTLHNETSEGACGSIVEAQRLDTLLLEPDCTQEVVLSVTPRAVGSLHILGLAYELSSTATEAAGAISIPGKKVFAVKPQRPRTTNDRVAQDAVDRRLEINVLEEAPCLQVSFAGLSSEMLSGELRPVTVTLANVGARPLHRALVAWSRADLLSLRGEKLSRLKKHGTARVELPASTLASGANVDVPMWLRAPDAEGNVAVEMMFYYDGGSGKKYRVVRHLWTVTVMPSVQLSLTAARSDMVLERQGSEEVMNLMVGVRNSNRAQDPVITEVCLVQLALASDTWRLADQVVEPRDVALQPLEMVHVMVKASRVDVEKRMFSSVPMTTDGTGLAPVDASPYLEFFLRCDASDHGHVDASEFNACEIKTTLKLEATLIARWKACVTDSEGNTRTVFGQHHLSVDRVGTVATTTAAAPPAGTVSDSLKIFGPDATIPAAVEKNAPFDVLQKLVTYSIQHAPSIAHNFTQNRLCIVPVRLMLQNCSNSPLVIKVNTMGINSSTSANKNQLYSPHSSGAFRWVTLAGTWLDVTPHGQGTVSLSAALVCPGTYDLGARLEVSCRLHGAPEADTVVQTWRIESSLVVNSS